MKKYLLLFSFICIYGNSLSQTVEPDKYPEELQKLKNQLQKFKEENQIILEKISDLKKSTDSTRKSIDSLKVLYQNQTNELKTEIKNITEKISHSEVYTEKRFSGVDEAISKNTLYWVIAVLATALMSALAYVFLRRKQNADRKDLVGQLTNAKTSIEENLVKEFTKQTELMEAQLDLMKNLPFGKSDGTAPDHSFALKVADEITMMERNLSSMDSKTKGLKQLNAIVSRLRDNLEANEYEIPVLLGKKFDNGMKLTVINSVPDENLKEGEEIISKVIKPTVNYKGKMIQSAQIEVSVG